MLIIFRSWLHNWTSYITDTSEPSVLGPSNKKRVTDLVLSPTKDSMCRHAIKKSSARYLHNKWHLGAINDSRGIMNNNQYEWGMNIQIMLIKVDTAGNDNDIGIGNGGHSLCLYMNTKGRPWSLVHCAARTPDRFMDRFKRTLFSILWELR